MKTTFDTDSILFLLLKGSPVDSEITGGIYVGDDRPDDSVKEDIVINSITLSQESLPQIGTSNVNIYVPDKNVKIGGKQQLKANRARLKQLSEIVMKTLRSINITGLTIILTNQTILDEPSVNQHFVNIRIDWNIQTIN
ncbi:MAG: hypothetical protein BWY38_01642 [Ignavibacteria bacterium ADurb.Bin266]|nr:MAG: hypothetical protein BWY38_01642 [Ignavibacteria bacterium ADurb.Bin266]